MREESVSTLHERHEARGAVFGKTYGFERPLYYPLASERVSPAPSPYADDSVPSPAHNAMSWRYTKTEFYESERREALAARNTVAMFDLSAFGKVRVSGPKALDVLQLCMTAEMDKPVGTVTYTLFCNERGGVLGDLTVSRVGPEEFYLVTLANQPAKVADHIANNLCNVRASADSCKIIDETADRSVLAINGPNSRALLSELVDTPLDNDSFAPSTVQQLRIAGVEATALRVSFAGELGWELHVPNEHAPKVYDALLGTGDAHGLVHGGTFALLNSLRTEKSFIHYGADVSMAETPLEAGLAFACKLKPEQPNFIGKDALVEQRQRGWTKRLVSVKAPNDPDLSLWGHEEELLFRNGELVGALTSGCYSHFLGCPIGLGFIRGPAKVPLKWLQEGTYEVEATTRDKDGNVAIRRFPVEVSTKSLVDPAGQRVRGQ